jgi:hypothetical protein
MFLVALLLCVVDALTYSGTECTKLVEFDLKNSTDIQSTDTAVATTLSEFPVYLSYSCRAAWRRFVCIGAYSSKGSNSSSSSMCASVCSELLSGCAAFFSVVERAQVIHSFAVACAGGSSAAPCAAGDPSAYFSQDETQCMHLTIVPDEHGATTAVEPSGCALPCPGTIYTAFYNQLYRLFVVLSALSFFTSLMATCRFGVKYWRQCKDYLSSSSSMPQRNASVFPVLMFCVGALVQATVNCATILHEQMYSVCEGNAKLRRADVMCFLQSMAILSSYTWCNCWVIVMALEAWTTVFQSPFATKLPSLRKWYLPVTSFITIATSAPMYIERVQLRQVCYKARHACRRYELRSQSIVRFLTCVLTQFCSFIFLSVRHRAIAHISWCRFSHTGFQQRSSAHHRP